MLNRHILVLGNGFDLQAQVPTSFEKFLLNQIKPYIHTLKPDEKLEDFRKNLIDKPELNILLNSQLTFWEFFLLLTNKTNWRDLEGAMREYCLSPEIGGNSSLKQHFEILNSNYFNSSIKSSEDAYLYFLSKKTSYDSNDYSIQDHIKYLVSELEITEQHFSDYIDGHIDKNKECKQAYRKNSNLLFKDIFLLLNIDERDVCDIYTFNYTTPWNLMPNFPQGHKINIHGKTKEKEHHSGAAKQIIGINKYNWTSTEEINLVRDFFKIERINRSPLLNSATLDNLAADLHSHKGAYRSISFFGHSLNDIDFPQLFSVLDVSNFLSDTSVRINFLFTNHTKTPSATASGDIRSKSEQFLSAYLKSRVDQSDELHIQKLYEILNTQVNFKFIDYNFYSHIDYK